MPALSETLRKESPQGFTPVVTAPARPPIGALPGLNNNFKNNPCIRTPLPPINAGPDTLRQFNQDGIVPMRRVLPLPVSNGLGGASVTNNNTTVVSSGGGGGSTVSLAAKVVVVKTSLLGPSATFRQTVAMPAKSFQLLSCIATGACEVRTYGSASAMAADSTRALDAPLAAELSNGLLSDVVLDTAPYQWAWQNRIGANSDNPQTNNLYVSITNLSSSTASPVVSVTFLPLES